MFTPADLRTPVVTAPMAGGPSTPELVAAVADAGGFGFLAAGDRAPDAVAADIAGLRRLSPHPFGVNLFAVPDSPGDLATLARFRRRLLPEARRLGVAVPEPTVVDGEQARVEGVLRVLERDPVAVVSTTFGLPATDAVARLHAVGTAVWVSVAGVADALAAVLRGVDALVVQGAEAGGHRATLRILQEPNDAATVDLVRAVRALASLPLVAAGGIATAADVVVALDAGADAVQAGTAFLLAPEAGTSAVHRRALVDPARAGTVVTRAFTGRPARGLANGWTARFADAPAAYPEVHRLTLPLRAAAAAAGEADGVHLWAGTRWRQARDAPAGDIVRFLLP